MARKPVLRHRPLTPETRDLRDYLHDVLQMGNEKRPTAEKIGRALGLTQNRAQSLIKEGLSSEDVLTLAEHYHLNPVLTLVDFGFLTMDQIHDAVAGENIREEKPETPETSSSPRVIRVLPVILSY